MQHLLVVADQALDEEPLVTVVRRRLDAGPLDVRVVVTVTAAEETRGLRAPAGSSPPDGGDPAEMSQSSPAGARRSLAHGVERLRELGVEVQGEIGDPDPMRAVADAFGAGPYDEVIVLTAPAVASRWLRAQVPQRIHFRHHVPVEVVTSSPAAPEPPGDAGRPPPRGGLAQVRLA